MNSGAISTINTQYMTIPTIVSPVKMEYGWNFSISGLQMMVKSGLEEIFLKFLYVEGIMELSNNTNSPRHIYLTAKYVS